VGEVEEKTAPAAHATQIVGFDQRADDGIGEQNRVAIAVVNGPDLQADEPVAADDRVDGRNADAAEVDGFRRPYSTVRVASTSITVAPVPPAAATTSAPIALAKPIAARRFRAFRPALRSNVTSPPSLDRNRARTRSVTLTV